MQNYSFCHRPWHYRMFLPPLDLSLSPWDMSVLIFCIIFSYLGHDVTGFLIQLGHFSSTHIFLFFCITGSSILSPDLVCHFCSFQYALVWQALFKYLLYQLLFCLGEAPSPHVSVFSLQLSFRELHISPVQWTELDRIIFSCISRILIQ